MHLEFVGDGSAAVPGCEFGWRLAAPDVTERDAQQTRRRDAYATNAFNLHRFQEHLRNPDGLEFTLGSWSSSLIVDGLVLAWEDEAGHTDEGRVGGAALRLNAAEGLPGSVPGNQSGLTSAATVFRQAPRSAARSQTAPAHGNGLVTTQFVPSAEWMKNDSPSAICGSLGCHPPPGNAVKTTYLLPSQRSRLSN